MFIFLIDKKFLTLFFSDYGIVELNPYNNKYLPILSRSISPIIEIFKVI